MKLYNDGSLELTVEEYVKLMSMNVAAPATNVVKDTVVVNPVKRGPGRPRKNIQQVEVVNSVEWLKTKEDVLHGTIKKRKGWKHTNSHKDRTMNTHKFYIGQDYAEKAAAALGIDKTNIYVIRPTASAKDSENYPKFYFIEQNWSSEIAKDVRCQYIQLWNRNHDFKLPSDICLHLSSKCVYDKPRKCKAKIAK